MSSLAEIQLREKERNEERYGVALSDLEIAMRVACELAAELPVGARLSELATRWVEEHRQLDQLRREEEQRKLDMLRLARDAWAKLSHAEREALGLTKPR